jgi:hypothetical protein
LKKQFKEKEVIIIKKLLNKIGYTEGEPQYYLSKRVCGLWLIWVSVIILVMTIIGPLHLISIPIFDAGYFLGIVLILGNKKIYKKLSFGPPSKFQKYMTFISIILMFFLLVGIGGHFFATQNYRMIWLSAFLAIGIHFLPFSTVHGKVMIPLGILVSINAVLGMLLSSVDFAVFAYGDILIKMLFGIIMLFSQNPLTVSNITEFKK